MSLSAENTLAFWWDPCHSNEVYYIEGTPSQDLTSFGDLPKMAMSEADMEQYAQMLDELCEKDPQGYEQLMTMMREQVAAATRDGSSDGLNQQPAADATASMLERIKQAAGGNATDASNDAFKPVFPGNKVMEKDGITTKQEGIYIDVTPGFVMKTTDLLKKQKVFVNICHSSTIQTFSQRKQFDDEGNEQEGIHVPLSLGAPHQVHDKRGHNAIAFDVAVNTQVIDDCQNDPTGSFRNFVCELAIEYIDQKYKIQLDPRYKLPKLTYRGELPPPKHYIRKEQKPIIQEIRQEIQKKPKVPVPRTAVATYKVYQVSGDERIMCSRVAAVEVTGKALSKGLLQQARSHLAICIRFETPVLDPNAIDLELRAEHVSIKAEGHVDLAFYLPFPVIVDQADVTLDRTTNVLELVAPIDKTWGENDPDCGSAPWLLAQALRDEAEDKENAKIGNPSMSGNEPPKSLVDMFHLAMPSTKDKAETTTTVPTTTPQWDPVDDDEELPEDRFHRKDMMSMHILEQRKNERQQKAADADAKRKVQRSEVEAKQRKAKEAGKTWQEMYPNEPETTYIDFEDILKEKQEKMNDANALENGTVTECMATETARQVAAAWSMEKETHGLDLQSALAFDLLD